MKQLIITSLFFLILFSHFCGCTKNFKVKEAVFNRAPKEVIKDLKKLHDFQDADIKWTVRQFGDSISHNLKVFLINGKDLPENDSALFDIGKNAMKLVVESIENDTAYNNFIVYFIIEKREGMMNTKEQIPFEYELSTLK